MVRSIANHARQDVFMVSSRSNLEDGTRESVRRNRDKMRSGDRDAVGVLDFARSLGNRNSPSGRIWNGEIAQCLVTTVANVTLRSITTAVVYVARVETNPIRSVRIL